jgi:ATP-dependent Zn protease
MDSNKNLKAKASVLYLLVAFFAFAALQELVIGPMMAPEEEVPYSQFRKDLAAGEIGEVTIEPERILYDLKGTEGSGRRDPQGRPHRG